MTAAMENPKAFQCTTDKQAAQLNRQNLHIARQFDNANFALVELMRQGITVHAVRIEGAHPEIEIQDGRATRALRSAVYATLSHGGHRRYQRRAMVRNCLVTWETDQGDPQ